MDDGYDYQYDHMNAGAHRRPASKIAAPALTWHRGFWRPTEETVGDEFPKPFDWRTLYEWHDRIDFGLAAIFHYFYKRALQDRTSERHHDSDIPLYFTCSNLEYSVLYLFSNKWDFSDRSHFRTHLQPISVNDRSVRHDIFYLRTEIEGVVVVVSARRHLEYFAITFTVEYSAPLETKSRRSREHANIAVQFDKLHDIAHRRFSANDKGRDENKNVRLKMGEDDARDVYNSDDLIVVPLKKWINDVVECAFKESPLDTSYSLGMFGGIFADFFGSIFALRISKNGQELDITGPIELGNKQELRLDRQVEGYPIARDVATKVADAMLSIARGFSRHRPGEEMYGSPEYSISLFQNTRVMYISSLGRIIPDTRVLRKRHEDVRYTLVVTYGSKWRLGRFVDRLHTLGILRIAALRDLQAITKSSNMINDAFSMLGGIPIMESHPAKMEPVYNWLDLSGKTIDVGITTRLERSRYYVANFKDLLEMMRPIAVEGFQSYANFVHARVFDAFEFVDRVGLRYEALRRAIVVRIEITQRSTMEGLQFNISRQTGATADLLTTAEILAVIPISYYSGTMLFHAHADLVREHPYLSWLPASELHCYAGGLLPGIAALLLSRAVRWISSDTGKRHLRHIWLKLARG